MTRNKQNLEFKKKYYGMTFSIRNVPKIETLKMIYCKCIYAHEMVHHFMHDQMETND